MQALCACIGDLFDLLSPWLNCAQPYLTASVLTSNIEAYSKEALNNKICRLIAANTQLMVNKMKTEKAKVNLKADKIKLFGKKNSLVVKRKEL